MKNKGDKDAANEKADASYYGPYDGPFGESVFNKPLFGFLAPANELPDLFKKTEGLSDDRLIALVSALLAEGRLEKVLSAILPRYKKLEENGQFSFSMKTSVLEALNLIPLHITESLNIVRLIRNEFAHNLDITTFAELSEKSKRKMATCVERTWGGIGIEMKTLNDQFHYLSFTAISGLERYHESITYLRSRLQSNDFVAKLQQDFTAECRAKLLQMAKEGPLNFSKSSTGWTYTYSGISIQSDQEPETFLKNQLQMFEQFARVKPAPA